jgi:hypothetical protein
MCLERRGAVIDVYRALTTATRYWIGGENMTISGGPGELLLQASSERRAG